MEKIISQAPSLDENGENLTKNKIVMSNGSTAERKTLRTLQLSSNGKLIGSQVRQSPDKKRVNKIIPFKKPLTIYSDKKPSPVETGVQTDKQGSVESAAQTEVSGATGLVRGVPDSHNDSGVFSGDADQEAFDLMVRDEVPESYWRDLAEERRLSLAEALSENETLHQSMEELKEENHNLSLMASQAEYFANLLNEALNDSKSVDTGEDENQESTEDKNIETTDSQHSVTDSQTPETSNEAEEGGQDKENKEDEAT